MGNEPAYHKLLHLPGGTYLLRENDNGDLRLSVRSNIRDGRSNKPKVGHTPIERAENGNGWIAGQKHYESISEIINSQKLIMNEFQPKQEYTPSNEDGIYF